MTGPEQRLDQLIEAHQPTAQEGWAGEPVCTCGYYLGATIEYAPHLADVVEREYVAARVAEARTEWQAAVDRDNAVILERLSRTNKDPS